MLFAGSRGEIVAFDEATGRVVWQTTLAGGLFGHLKSADMTLIDHASRLFVGANGYVICLSKQDGRELWRHSIEGAKQDWVALAIAGRAAVADSAIIEARRRDGSSSSDSGNGDGGGD